MPDFKPILFNTLKLEGGETTDTGGHTNYGVTQKSFDAYASSNNLPSKNVSNLNFGDVKNFYETDYYKKPGIDLIPSQKVGGVVFDYGVNAGVGTAIKKLQEIVGAKVDGKLGKKTLSAIDSYIKQNGEDFLASQILNKRAEHYIQLANSNPDKYGRYLQGWMNRISAVKQMYNL